MSDYSGSPSDHMESQPPKRKATTAGLDGNTTGRSVKRRASKACQCCRARKVRCNVTEHGAPCTNCRLDEVECIVSESRRKKSVTHSVQHPTTPLESTNLRCYTLQVEYPALSCFSSSTSWDWCSLLPNKPLASSPTRYVHPGLLAYTRRSRFQPQSSYLLTSVGNGTKTMNCRQRLPPRQQM